MEGREKGRERWNAVNIDCVCAVGVMIKRRQQTEVVVDAVARVDSVITLSFIVS